ncbi:MAG: hypothetical protein IK115_12345 [Lachnospiraceae bacterium]|nr:hypothetical protein [Lachnospiraceae bacterium]
MKMLGSVKLFCGKNSVADYTEISYYDDEDRLVEPDEASRILIREMLADGTVLKETWGFCGYARKATA